MGTFAISGDLLFLIILVEQLFELFLVVIISGNVSLAICSVF